MRKVMRMFYRKKYRPIPCKCTGSDWLVELHTGAIMMEGEKFDQMYLVGEHEGKHYAVRRHCAVYPVDRDKFGAVQLRDVFGREKWLSKAEFEKRYELLEVTEQSQHNRLVLPVAKPDFFNIDY